MAANRLWILSGTRSRPCETKLRAVHRTEGRGKPSECGLRSCCFRGGGRATEEEESYITGSCNYVKGRNPQESFGIYDTVRHDTIWLDKA